MRFKSPTEDAIYIGLTTGHTCSIGPEWVEVDPRSHREAVVRGAIPEGTEHVKVPKARVEQTRNELITETIRAMIAEAKPEDFTNDGKVNAVALSTRVGFTVSSSERDAAWQVVSEGA